MAKYTGAIVILLTTIAGCTCQSPEVPDDPVETADTSAVDTLPTEAPLPFVDVAISSGHRCGLTTDGSFQCWQGAVDDEMATTTFVAIGGSDSQVCGVTATHTVLCMDTISNVFVQPVIGLAPNAEVQDISAGPTSNTWCVTASGQVSCDATVFEETDLVGASRGHGGTCAWRSSGETLCEEEDYYTKYYGNGRYFFPGHVEVLDGTVWPNVCAVRSDQALQCFESAYGGPVLSTPPAGVFERVWTARNFACARTQQGELACWGLDGPAVTPRGPGWGEVSMLGNQACAVSADQRIQCWTL